MPKRAERRRALQQAHQEALQLLNKLSMQTTGIGTLLLYSALRYLNGGEQYSIVRKRKLQCCASVQFWKLPLVKKTLCVCSYCMKSDLPTMSDPDTLIEVGIHASDDGKLCPGVGSTPEVIYDVLTEDFHAYEKGGNRDA